MPAQAPRREALDEDLDIASRLISGAAEMALGFYGRPGRSELKADGSPVGEADLALDRMLTDELRRLRPGDGLLSEESGPAGPSARRRWIIDPIDGTEGFLAGQPNWGTHLALERDGEIVLGIVSRPVTGTQWWAVRGAGAFRGDLGPPGSGALQPVRLSPVVSLREARVTGWKVDSLLDPLLPEASWFDCEYNDLMAVLEGRAEVMIVPGEVWDHAPFLVLLEESGGSLFDPEGGHRLDRDLAYYTNGGVDAELTTRLWPARPPRGRADA